MAELQVIFDEVYGMKSAKQDPNKKSRKDAVQGHGKYKLARNLLAGAPKSADEKLHLRPAGHVTVIKQTTGRIPVAASSSRAAAAEQSAI